MEMKSEKGGEWMSPEKLIQRWWDVKSDGEPPIWKFNNLRLPDPISRKMTATGILPLTPMQCQGLRVALTGADLVGISFTNPGKMLVAVLPLIKAALRGKGNGEGPYGFAVFPSEEMAVQAFRVLEQFRVALKEFGGYRDLDALLCVEENSMESGKVHADIIVATIGSLRFMLANNMIVNVENCRYLALDEAPLADMEEILDHFKSTKDTRQTVVLCASMTPSIRKFVRTLRKFSWVDAGRVGAPWLNAEQEVKYVNKQEEKLSYILECLKGTKPPILIICKIGAELDRIYKHLVSQGVRVTAIHGYMDKLQREEAILSFKFRKSDVMVATDTASAELSEIRNIHQVINYEMPSNIESYFRRIALVGRIGGPRGRALTFIDKTQNLTALLDLKHYLESTNQRIPPEFAHLVAMEPDSQSIKRIRKT